jgi:hypothetical protein
MPPKHLSICLSIVLALTAGCAAWYAERPDRFEAVMSGTIRVTSVDSANNVEGSVDLQFPSRRIVTAFSASWINGSVLCG